jgi:DNA-binding XRE family transcriptional regulator
LKTFRKQKKLNQTQFAEKMHVTQETISHWECGKRQPNLTAIITLCQSFQMPIEHLFT